MTRLTRLWLGLLVPFVLLAASPAPALDLDGARADGAVVARALALGNAGDWAEAEAVAARSGDVLIRDIVLWRKLRAGAGSVQEFQSFTSRRGTWPGQEALAEAVLGARGGATPRGVGSLNAPALKRWREFSRLWDNRDYLPASRMLVGLGPAEMGNPAVWADRRAALVRRMARKGYEDLAYRLAAKHGLTPEDGYDYSEQEWLAGWVALRKQGAPGKALPHFERFEQTVGTPISLGRGGYWVGRALDALGRGAEARKAYARAAQHQTSFYGQLAAAAIDAPGDPTIVALELPDWQKSPITRSDDVRMAAILHFAEEDSLAFQAFTHLGQHLDGSAAVGALADLALKLGRPHYAVRIAKNATYKGQLLMPAYYPVTELAGYATDVEPALALSIARQETELNPRAVSGAGARGLMQVMPGTAKLVAEWIGEPFSEARLTDDWKYNARLGQRYLAQRIREYGGSYAMAAAAYNAGKARVDEWIGEIGDPRRSGTDIVDWIESIPFSETRNYVQRVMESLYVYRARLGGEAGPMTIVADLARGRTGGCGEVVLSC